LRVAIDDASVYLMKGIDEIARDCLELPVSQRLRLVRVLLDASETDLIDTYSVGEAWDEEICARMEAVRNGVAGSQSVEEFLLKLESRRPA
jgi:hypothetical protein